MPIRACTIRGRLPIGAKTCGWPPCWPTLALSWNQISIGVPTVLLASAARTEPAKTAHVTERQRPDVAAAHDA